MLGALPVSSPAPSASAASPAPPAGDNSGDVGAAEAPPAVSGGGDAGGATPQAAAERAASAPAAMAAPVNVGQLQSLAAKVGAQPGGCAGQDRRQSERRGGGPLFGGCTPGLSGWGDVRCRAAREVRSHVAV